jgi:zinc protease
MPFVAESVTPWSGGLQIHTFRFDNGLVLRVVPDTQAPVVAWQTWFRVGSSDEVVGKTGLAHLFEHMMFKGTADYDEGTFQARVDAMGGSRHLNAWTWLDQTVYVGAVPADRLEDYAVLEASRMTRLVVDEAAFRSELEVVINERRLVVDNDPNGLLDEQLMHEAFREHPYGWPTIGWQADLDALTADDARAFYQRWYAPDNATIVLVGQVAPEAAAAVVDRHFGALPAAGVVRPTPAPEPAQTAARRIERTLPLSAERLQLLLKTPAFADADTPALLVLSAALTSGASSRLVRALRDAGLVAEVGSFVAPLRHPGALQISLTGRPDVSIAVAEAALWRELDRVAADGISEGELALGVAQWETATWAKLADASGKADFLGWAAAHTGDPTDGLARIRRIQAVTRDEVARVARAVLQRSLSTTGVGRPAAPPTATPPLPALVEPAVRRRTEARAPVDLADQPSEGVVRQAVGGATLLTAFDPALPIVGIQLVFAAGAALDPAGRAGAVALLGELWMRGTTRRSRSDFEETLDQLGAAVSVSVSADAVTVSGRALTRTWPQFVGLLQEALASPALDADELARLQDEVAAELVATRDSDEEMADRGLQLALYGADHPYGREVRGREETLRAVTVADLQALHAQLAVADGAVVGLSGAFDAQATADVAALLAALGTGPRAEVQWPARPTGAPRRLLVDKPERSQAQVRLGCAGLDVRGADFPAFVLFNEAFGTGFGGRLMKEVRVQRGWSYYAYAFPALHGRGADWEIRLAPSNAYAADATALALSLVRVAHADGLTDDEVTQARATRLNGLPFDLDTASKRLELAIRALTLGYDRVAATRAMVGCTPADTLAALRARVEPAGLAVVVLGTASDLRAPLEAALGPFEVIAFDAL